MINKRSSGFTLVEMAVGLVVLGLLLVLAWRIGFGAAQRIRDVEAPQALQAADQALLGFAAAHSRLPCPDTTGQGNEQCGNGNSIGALPWRTLGLARADVRGLRYGVYRDGVELDLSGPSAEDSFRPFLALEPSAAGIAPTAYNQALGQANGLDLCDRLRQGAGLNTPVTRTALHIARPGAASAPGVPLKHVAYAIAMPDARSDPDQALNRSGNGFGAPGQAISADYGDHVLVADFNGLFDRMACAGVLTAAGHSHMNAATSSALMLSAMYDYRVQLVLSEDMAKVAVQAASAGVISATAATTTAASGLTTATATTVATMGTAAPMIAFAAAEIASNALALAASIGVVVQADRAQDVASQRVREFSGDDPASKHLLEHAKALATSTSAAAPALPSIRINAIAADAAGLY
jgi:prepilin-type N-terminal cleavage/methylation domain-containing protein